MDYEKILIDNLGNMTVSELRSIIRVYNANKIKNYSTMDKFELINLIKNLPLTYVLSDKKILNLINKYNVKLEKIKYRDIEKEYGMDIDEKSIKKHFKDNDKYKELKVPKIRAMYKQRFKKLRDEAKNSYTDFENALKTFYIKKKQGNMITKDNKKEYEKAKRKLVKFTKQLDTLNNSLLKKDDVEYEKIKEKKKEAKKKENKSKGKKKLLKKKRKKVISDEGIIKKLDKLRGKNKNYNLIDTGEELMEKILDNLGLTEDEYYEEKDTDREGEPPIKQLYTTISGIGKIAVNRMGDPLGLYNDLIDNLKK